MQIQPATQASVDEIKGIGDTIQSIAGIAAAMAQSVEQQGAATQEMARNVRQAPQGATHVTGNIGEVSRGASDTGVAADQVYGSA